MKSTEQKFEQRKSRISLNHRETGKYSGVDISCRQYTQYYVATTGTALATSVLQDIAA